MNEFDIPRVGLHDILQVIIGATILALPVGLTREVWEIAITLPFANIVAVMFLSILFISAFTFYHYYKHGVAGHERVFITRILSTYCFTFITVAVILTVLQVALWLINWQEALRIIVLVTLPASMSAAVADTLH